MKVLFIGGTGNISIASTRLVLERGHELFLLNRGISSGTALKPAGAHWIQADINHFESVKSALQGHNWDVVVDWIAYEPRQVEQDIQLFLGRTSQYIFISSASVYQKSLSYSLITESTPLENPFWQYSRDKIACEQRLGRAFTEQAFPVTIIRPALTYGESWIPSAVGGHDYTLVQRMKKHKKIVVHEDGQSFWVMTHNTDFAKGLIGLLGNQAAIGEAFHITSDEVLTWDQIYRIIGEAAGIEPHLIHIPSEFIGCFDERLKGSLLGDKAHSMVFDNSKIKEFVPGFQATVSFAEGVRQSIRWFEAVADRQKVNADLDRLMDRIVAAYEATRTSEEKNSFES